MSGRNVYVTDNSSVSEDEESRSTVRRFCCLSKMNYVTVRRCAERWIDDATMKFFERVTVNRDRSEGMGNVSTVDVDESCASAKRTGMIHSQRSIFTIERFINNDRTIVKSYAKPP